ncbi:MAG TPA: glutamine synthetase family protein [Acidimicrobiales bacterium]|nr:glutamine synthetase family protein [Acidimicrobiales bacterium]
MAEAREVADGLRGSGVRAVALTWVDNAGITRVKAVPVDRLEEASRWGVGMSPVFDVYLSDDSMTSTAHTGGPVGDLRLFPDLDRLVRLHPEPRWAWAPVDRRTQEDDPYDGCQRTFARTMTARAASAGLSLKTAFEVEWFVGYDEGDGTTPACRGPAYGMTRVVELADYLADVLEALEAEGVPVEQLHPEYAPGQMELAVAAAEPVEAADRLVLVKQTIRAVSQAYGLRPSFAPVVVAGLVGNGGHLHFSVWSGGRNLFAGAGGPHGLSPQGESVLAGLLEHLPALCAVGAPSVASYLRLVPQRWAGAYRCWGRENREAGLRLVTGTRGSEATAANAELKCFDLSANPYLVVGAVVAVVCAARDRDLRLPSEVTVDPASLPAGDQPPRLPQSLAQAVEAMTGDAVLREAMGEVLFEAFLAVRRAEVERFAGRSDEDVAAATRWIP